MRATQTWERAVVAVAFGLTLQAVAQAQQLKDLGMLATGTLSRTRSGTNEFHLGDMMYITAFQPADTGGMYVSAHMEYKGTSGSWQPVPTASTALGTAYRSGSYPGVRDYVKFDGTTANTTRHICLFMPYEAADLGANRDYLRRYVVRVWDRHNTEIANTVLPEEEVHTEHVAGTLVIRTVQVKCAAPMADARNMEPVPESRDTGSVRYFSASSGKWVCNAGSD